MSSEAFSLEGANSMKVLMINISLRPESHQLYFPIGPGYIASAIKRADFDLEILDIDAHRYTNKEIEVFIKEKEYDLVAFGCIVTGYKIVKRLAEIIKKYKKVPIVCGNSVASSIPKFLLSRTQVDIAVIGEGDITIVELLKAIENNESLQQIDGICFKKNGEIIWTSPRSVIANIDTIPLINWDLFDTDIYISKSEESCHEPYPVDRNLIRAMPLNTARGCPYHCSFCYHVFKNNKYRVRSPQSVCGEIRKLKEKYGINYINFWDELTFYSIKQCENFVDTLLKEDLKIYWTAGCRADLFKEKDFDLAVKLRKSGCIGLGYSLESANKNILKAMNKNITVAQFTIQTRILQKAEIATWTSLVIGYPQETEQSIQQTFDCCYNNNIYPSVGYILPQPNTPIYDYAVRTGKIKNEEEYLLSIGDRQNFSINFTQMEQSKIEELVKKNLSKISKKLNIKLEDGHLIKTGVYRAKNT